MKSKESPKASNTGVVLALSMLTSVVSVVYVAPLPEPTLFAVLVKILPCLALISYVWLNQYATLPRAPGATSWNTLLHLLGIASNDLHQTDPKDKKRNSIELKNIELREKLSVGITQGLFFSAIGDAFLIYHEVDVPFMLGMVAFAVAHVCYIRGLGFEVVSFVRAACCYPLLGVLVLILQDAPQLFVYTVPCYGVLLTTLLWRAIDRCYVRDGRKQWQGRAMVAGAAVFALSDTSLATFKFLLVDTCPTVAQSIIIGTYYVAQTLLTVGAVGCYPSTTGQRNSKALR